MPLKVLTIFVFLFVLLFFFRKAVNDATCHLLEMPLKPKKQMKKT